MKVVTAKVGLKEIRPRVGFCDGPKTYHFISKNQIKVLDGKTEFDKKLVRKIIEQNKDGVLADGKTPYMIIEGKEDIIKRCFNKSGEEIINLIINLTKKENQEENEEEESKAKMERKIARDVAMKAEKEIGNAE